MSEMPFIPGILILLLIVILSVGIYMRIANNIGEKIRMFFLKLYKNNNK